MSLSLESPIAESFNRAAKRYASEAVVQQQVARRLVASLEPWREILPPGSIIELGCGTGFLSAQLAELFPERALIFSDIAPQMLAQCKQQVGAAKNHEFRVLDAQQKPEMEVAMSISNFTAQWFKHPALTLGRWLEHTKPGGLLLAAIPAADSFPEWEQHCQKLGLPFTANTLPDTEEMVIKLSSDATQVDYYEDTVTQKFDDAAAFFRHLKQIGAHSQRQGRHLSAKELRLLIRHWNDAVNDGPITVSWHVLFLAVKKMHVAKS